MALKTVNPEQTHAFRDRLEVRLQAAVTTGFKKYLNETRSAARAAVDSPLPNVLLAAGGNHEMPTMGNLAAWWAQQVDEQIMDEVRAAFIAGLKQWTDQGIDLDSPALLASRDYLAQVRDRLVLGTHMGVTVYEDSFNRIRAALAQSAAQGWTRQELAQRIATELSWEDRGPYWRAELAKVDKQMDDILDALGEPGTPAREAARLSDPTIQSLRNDRNYIIKHLDDERSVWQTRARLIARTEATGAANFGGMQAFVMEGVKEKEWLASGGPRTRLTHSDASGQTAPVLRPFMVGGALMQYPGDPAGPVQEVANCRCTMIAADSRVQQ